MKFETRAPGATCVALRRHEGGYVAEGPGFYIWDEDWGYTFWKTNSYAPYPIWLWLNGHEYAKRAATAAGYRSAIQQRWLCRRRGALTWRNWRAGRFARRWWVSPGTWRRGNP